MEVRKTKAEYHRTDVVVAGRGRFPLDMLRYDKCVPASEDDAYKIQSTFDGKREEVSIRLDRFSCNGGKAMAMRWISFGWTVTYDSGV